MSFLALWFATFQAFLHLFSLDLERPAIKPLTQESIIKYSGPFAEVVEALPGNTKSMQMSARRIDLKRFAKLFISILTNEGLFYDIKLKNNVI
jgi:hypothetical protein